MKNDMKQRVRLARINDASRQIKVSAARRIIYEKDFGVSSAPVERLLKPDSLVPVLVSLS